MRRRNFLAGAGAGTVLAGTGLSFAANGGSTLPQIPVIDAISGFSKRVGLNLQAGFHDFGTGTKSSTFRINQSYLGPVIRVKQGQTLPFDVSNNLDETATLHWHGLHIPGDVDGVSVVRVFGTKSGVN